MSPADEPVPAAAPPRVAALVAGSPDQTVEVLHRATAAWYLGVRPAPGAPARVIAVVGPGAVPVPCALRLAARLPGTSARARLEAGHLVLAGRRLRVARLVDVTVRPRRPVPRPTTPAVPLPVGYPLLPAPDGPDLPARLGLLVGRGPGLTPLGDDLVAGWLAALHLADGPPPPVIAAVRSLLPRTTTVSAALLEAGLAGEAADPVRHHLAALGTDAEAATRRALLAVGHTSGSGLLAGIHAALEGPGRTLAPPTPRRAA
jgi:hypothetical protein